MGLGGISIWQLLIILVIVILLFGTKKLRNMGGDLGSAVKNFRGAMKDGEQDATKAAGTEERREPQVIEGQAEADNASSEQKENNKA